jgi:hypothetical protein
MRLRYLLSGRRIMMQQTFGQPYDADIDRTDGGLPVQRQDKFCASAADLQRQDVRYVSG